MLCFPGFVPNVLKFQRAAEAFLKASNNAGEANAEPYKKKAEEREIVA